ncbi:MAG: hypothetical protein RLZZ338_3531 [Cyanobacteriota bacterium]|jgi:16S rRNA (guanine(966)-N(2))-methyltransferase RsmD
MSIRIYGNRLLKTLPGLGTRPTPARVREAVFNIWQGSIAGCRWLDLCGGSGSMGAEALCRGAKHAIALEQSPRACSIIRENWQQVTDENQSFQVLRGDVVTLLKKIRDQQFDRVYFDPPYASDLYQPVLEIIAGKNLLAPDGEIGIEHQRDRVFPETIGNLEIARQKVYGNTGLTFYGYPSEDLLD